MLHDGPIEVLIADGDFFITAGGDGYVKWWRQDLIDQAEAEEGLDFEMKPVKQLLISSEPEGKKPAHIMNMIKAQDKWYLQDRKGHIFVLDETSGDHKAIYSFHEGCINDVVCSPSQNYALTIGEDGTVKCWDYVRKTAAHSQSFEGGGTCLEHMGHHDANKGRIAAAGFDNGLVRILSMTVDGIQILKAFKAHDDAISILKFSADMKMLATASVAGDVFFFECDGTQDLQRYEPLCTLRLGDTRVNSATWNADDQSIVFACSNGFMYEVRRPKPSEIDNSDSYLWEKAEVKEWCIKIMEFQMAKNQKKDEAEEEKKRRMRLRGELPPEEDEPEEVWEPCALNTIVPFNAEDGTRQFLCATEGQFNGFIYICDFEQMRPVKAIEIPAGLKVTHMRNCTKKGGEILAISYDNGMVEVIVNRRFDRRMNLKDRDIALGRLTATTLNADESFFLTVGADGLMFAYQFDKLAAFEEVKFEPLSQVEGANFLPADEKKAVALKKLAEFHEKNPAVIPEANEELALDEAALAVTLKTREPLNKDVEDPTVYSIQQSKLRTEEDHRLSLAEKKKDGERVKVNALRGEFNALVERNTAADAHLRLTEDDFQIDAEYFLILQERNDKKIKETKKEEAWDIEYNTARLNKLKNKYYDVLEFDKFTVKAVRSPAYVTTFRVQRMSEFLQANIQGFKRMLEDEIVGKDAEEADDFVDDQSKDGDNQVDAEKQKEKEKQAAIAAKQKAAQQALQDAKKTEAEKKREQRKVEREKRWHEIEKYRRQEVMQNDEDDESRKKIEEAQATYGDYKLKIAHDYTVPENARINFQKKRQQMVLLEGSIHKLKVDFNQKIQDLKVRKKQIVEHVTAVNARLQEINGELGVGEELFVPTIDKVAEYPETFFETTEEDLEAYKAKLEREKEAAKAKGQKGGAAARKAQEEADAAAKAAEEEDEDDAEDKAEAFVPVDLKTVQTVPRKGAKPQMLEFDEEYDQIRNIELVYEKDQKKSEIEELIRVFDEEIREMQKEKYRLESDLKNAEMKFIVFFEELILLKSMEGKDQRLTRSLAECRKQKGSILREINDISRQLKAREKEIAGIGEREQTLKAKFHELCPERSDKYDIIRPYFEKIIKRRPKREKIEKGDDEDDEDGDEEEDEEVEEDDDEDEDDEENAIAGLSPEEYKIEEIDKLREERLELHDEKQRISDGIKSLEDKRKKLEQYERAIKQELQDTEDEIQDFQAEKMSKLNELRVAIVLKMKQLQNLVPDPNRAEEWERRKQEGIKAKIEALSRRAEEEGLDDQTVEQMQREIINEPDWRGFNLPNDLGGSILFTRTQLLQLIDRKREIDEEIDDNYQQLRQGKRSHKAVEKEINANEAKRADRERQYDERRMLRFGNLVDLDSLEVGGPSAVVIELQNKFNKTEKVCFKRIEEADSNLEETQRDLTEQMKKNTGLLDLIRTLGEKQHDLEHKLTGANNAIFVDEDEAKKMQQREEKNRIKNLLQTQAKEIETFKTEINMYKRKGGHIYTKVTTNRRVANLNQDN